MASQNPQIPDIAELEAIKTKAPLLEIAGSLGLTLRSKATVAEIKELILAAAAGGTKADSAPKAKADSASKTASTPKAGSDPKKSDTSAKAGASQKAAPAASAKVVAGPSKAELDVYTVAQLQEMASGLELTFKKKDTKAVLIDLIVAAPATAPASATASEPKAAAKSAEKKPAAKATAAKTASKAKSVDLDEDDFEDELEDELADDYDDDDDIVDEDLDDDDDDDEDIEDYDDGIDDEKLAAGNVPDEVEEDEDIDVVDLDIEPDGAELATEVADLEADLEADLVDDDEVEDTEDAEDDESESETEGEGEAGAADDESFTVSDKDEDDQPAQQVVTAGATADPVKDYLKQIGKVALLNAEQEVELAKRIEAGLYAERTISIDFPNYDRTTADLDTRKLVRDLQWVANDGRNAKNHLLEANLRLVVSLAKRYTGRGMLFLDLIQEGNLGLIRAVEKFDYTKGYKFSTYATWWIRQAITRAMADQARTIRIPVHMVEVINKLARVQRQMLQDFGREPTPEELAKELDMTPEKVIEVQKYGREPISLHTPLGEDGDSEFGDLIEDSEAVVPADAVSFTLLQDQLHQVLETLSEREAGVVAMRFGLQDGQPKTLDEIGKVYGVTRERIRQIESKTMSKLRHPSRSQVLRDYLD